MTDLLELTGVVLKTSLVGEYDRRMVILTKERGKITAFAKGARRPKSGLLAISCPFVCGTFYLYEGRNAYTLKGADVIAYFEKLQTNLDALCYASYFTELAEYFSRENMTASEMLNLLYLSFRALEKGQISLLLIRYIVELRMMVLDGEYTQEPPISVMDSASYAWRYVISCPLEKLFSFTLSEQALRDFARAVSAWRIRVIDREFHSLAILESLI